MRVAIEDIGGVTTRYYHCGAGSEAVLLLHGVGVGADSWFWNLQGLGDHRKIIAPDMLGFGFTAEHPHQHAAPQELIVDHLVSLVGHLGIERLLVVGSSFGSNIACHLYWRLKAKIAGVVLVGCGPALNGPGSQRDLYEKSFTNGLAAMKDPTLDVCRRRMSNLVFDISTVPEGLLLSQLTLYSLSGARDRFERLLGAIKTPDNIERFDVSQRMSTIEVPTLVVWGRQDARGSLAEAEQVASRIPRVRMEIFENCGHLPYLEYPIRFNALVREFAASLPGI